MPVFTPSDPAAPAPEPYATSDDVALLFKRPLTTQERDLADHLAGVASRRLRRRFRTLDARIAAGELDPLEVTDVVADAVRRAITGGEHGEAVTSQQQTAGPFSQQVTYANPLGNLYFTAENLAALSENGAAGRVRSIRLTSANTD